MAKTNKPNTPAAEVEPEEQTGPELEPTSPEPRVVVSGPTVQKVDHIPAPTPGAVFQLPNGIVVRDN